jgi:ABC-2 type transport system permease protein
VTRLVAAELFKLRTTRAFYALAAGALGFTLLIISLGAIFDEGELRLEDVMMIAFFAQLITLVIGILCITNEFRHGTITPTLLVSPIRPRVVLAKVAASLLVGVVLGLVACAIIAGVVALDGGESDNALKVIAGGATLAGVYAVLGVGLGAIIRNQVGAIIGALVYILLLEGLIGLVPGIDDVLPIYGLGGTSQSLRATDVGDTDTDFLAQVPGGLLLAGYVVVFVIVGIAVMRNRDVTA